MDNIHFDRLEEDTQPQVTFAVPNETKPVLVSEPELSTRAAKYDFALGDKSPGIEKLKERISLNLEQQDREKLALEKQTELFDLKNQMIKDINTGAAQRGESLNSIEAQTILDLSQSDIDNLKRDPNTFFEREFARRVISTAIETGQDSAFDGAIIDGDKAFEKLDLVENVVAAKEAYQRLAVDANERVAQQSMRGYVADSAKGLVPFYIWSKLHDILSKEAGGSFLVGNNLAEQVEYAYSGNLEERLPLVKATIEELSNDNPQLAAMFANALVSYSSSSRFIDNLLISGTDLSVFLPLGLASRGLKAAVKAPIKTSKEIYEASKIAATSSSARLNKVISDVTSTVLKKEVTMPEVLDSVGKTTESASMSIVQKIQDRMLEGGGTVTSFKSLTNEIPGFMNPSELLGGVRSTLSTKQTTELLEDLVMFRDQSLKALFEDPIKQGRFGDSAVDAALKVADQVFRTERRDIENSIMNVLENKVDDGLGNHTALIHIGNEAAKPFEYMELAEIYAKQLGFENYQLVPLGNKWTIQIERPLDFTAKSVREAMKVDVKNAPSPMSNVIGRALTKLRSGEDIMDKSTLDRFKVATYGASGFERMLTDRARNLGVMLKNSKDFNAFIKSQQIARNPTNPDKLGKFSNTVGEFEIEWAGKFNRLPSFEETKAYFAYKSINDLEYAGINLGLYLDKQSAGLTMNRIPGLSVALEGKVSNVAAFADNKENAKILFLEEGAEPKFANSRFNEKIDPTDTDSERIIDHIKKMVETKGYVVTQLSDTGSRVLKGLEEVGDFDAFKGANVDFIVSNSVRSEPLSLKHIPYQSGGHRIMPDGFFISSPQWYKRNNVTKYYGDTNLFFAANEKLAKEVAGKFEKARLMYLDLRNTKKSNPDFLVKRKELQKYIRANLPVTPSQFFKDYGRKGRLDADAPVLARASNQNLDAAHKLHDLAGTSEYIRASDSVYNLYRGRVNLQYALDRGDDVMEVVTKGSATSPLYGMRPASVIDPMAAMDRGLNSLVRRRFFEPVKLETAERFMSEFGDLLNDSFDELGRDPFVQLQKGDFKTNLKGSDLERLRQAESYRARALQFFGVDTQEMLEYKWMASKLVGDNPEAVSSWRKSLAEIITQKDPVNMVRELAYHMKMGLFNPKQLLQQSNTWVNVIGVVGPTLGTKAGLGAMVQNFILMNPKALSAEGAKIISKLGFEPSDFVAATEALRRTGFDKMGRETATRAQHLQAKIVQTEVGGMLDHGLFFVRKGEEFVRRTAWNASYFEWLAKNKGKKPTDRDLSTILARADFLNVNMSHASNAAWQSGFSAVPTQFWSYQIRLMEQLTGKRMTPKEKGRLLSTYSLVYGVPVTAGVMTFWPAHESIKEYLQSKSIDTDDNAITKVLNDGLLSVLTELATGEDTTIEIEYGPRGFPLLKDLMEGDKNVVEALAGPAGNTLYQVLDNISPAIGWIKAAIMPGEEALPVKPQDFMDVFNSISSVKYMNNMFVAATTNAYLTKYGDRIATEDDSARRLFNVTLGIQPQKIEDMYRKMQMLKNYEAHNAELTKEIKKDIRNMLNATTLDEKNDWRKRAQIKGIWLNDPVKSLQIWGDVMKENKDIIEKISEENFRRSPEARAYERKQRDKYIKGKEKQ